MIPHSSVESEVKTCRLVFIHFALSKNLRISVCEAYVNPRSLLRLWSSLPKNNVVQMASEESVVDRTISYFSEKNLTDKFKQIFLAETLNDRKFQEKLKDLSASGSNSPCYSDELLMRKIIQINECMSPAVKEKLFTSWRELLHITMQSSKASDENLTTL